MVLRGAEESEKKKEERRDAIRNGFGLTLSALSALALAGARIPKVDATSYSSPSYDDENEVATPTAPNSGLLRRYSGTDHKPHWITSSDAIIDEAIAGADYIIFIDSNDSNKIKARNGFTGAIDYSGTDAATVINNAISNLAPGRTTKQCVKVKGNLTINTAIDVPDYTILDLRQAHLTLADNVNASVIKVHNGTGVAYFVDIIGGYIDGNLANQNAGYCIDFLGALGSVRGTQMWNGHDGGIEVEPGTSPIAYENVFEGLNVKNYGTATSGLEFLNGATDNMLTDSVFAQGSWSGYGISVKAADNSIKGCHCYRCSTGISIRNTFGVMVVGCCLDHLVSGVDLLSVGSYMCEHNTVTGCFFYGAQSGGTHIALDSDTAGSNRSNSIVGNVFRLATTDPAYCIVGSNVADISIVGNSFVDGYSTAPLSLTGTRIIATDNSGLNLQGYGITTPSEPSSGNPQQNTNPFPVRIYILSASGASCTITDPSGNTGPSITLSVGQELTLDALASITPTYSSLTWKWYGV